MDDRERFFFEHAGYGYNPAHETAEEGRERCARELAAAEREMIRRGWSIRVEDDPDVMEDDAGTVEEVAAGNWLNLVVDLLDEDGDLLQCLGGVTVLTEEGYNAPYVTVCGVEMADEQLRMERTRDFLAACSWAALPAWVQQHVLIREEVDA